MKRVEAVSRREVSRPTASAHRAVTHSPPAQHALASGARAVAQRAMVSAIQDSPASVAQGQALDRLLGGQAAPVQRLAISNRKMRQCGFVPFKGIEWVWVNPAKQPNHVSALLEDGNVDHIHAKSEFSKARVNRLDWDEGADGEWAGPAVYKQQAEEEWDDWRPLAIDAGEQTIRLLKQNATKPAK